MPPVTLLQDLTPVPVPPEGVLFCKKKKKKNTMLVIRPPITKMVFMPALPFSKCAKHLITTQIRCPNISLIYMVSYSNTTFVWVTFNICTKLKLFSYKNRYDPFPTKSASGPIDNKRKNSSLVFLITLAVDCVDCTGTTGCGCDTGCWVPVASFSFSFDAHPVQQANSS